MSDTDPAHENAAAGDASAGANPSGAAQVGWYPDPTTGQLRWWDGQQWGEFQGGGAVAPVGAGSSDPKSQAALAHYLGAGGTFLFCGAGWIGPLIFYTGQGKNDPFIRDQAAEALNFQLTVTIALVISSLLIFVIIGLILVPIVWLAGSILGVIGGMAASRGEWYRYPMSIKFVKTEA